MHWKTWQSDASYVYFYVYLFSSVDVVGTKLPAANSQYNDNITLEAFF